ncbi:MAG: zinc-ribbon domain-containing protein [Opitutaceae bacterium]|nr:zinc-ribbon domain-containing protein [Opitutaceae bacterium]
MFCSKCGKSINQDAAFCSSCGTRVGRTGVEKIAPLTAPTASAGDISWGTVAANLVGMMLIAYLTYPVSAHLERPEAIVYLLIRVGIPAVLAVIVTGLFYIFRRKKERRLLRRSFVMASWVFLGLIVLGERI